MRRTRKLGVMCAASMVFGLIVTNLIIKNWAARIRPYEMVQGLNCIVPLAKDWSFPSGHTQNVFAAFGAPARYLKKAAVVIPCVLIILLTAVSRMYLGVHTPYDVGFSVLFGLVLMFLLYPLFRDMEERPDNVYVFMILMLLISIAGLFLPARKK